MHGSGRILAIGTVLAVLQAVASQTRADEAVQLGPRPFCLVDKPDAGTLVRPDGALAQVEGSALWLKSP